MKDKLTILIIDDNQVKINDIGSTLECICKDTDIELIVDVKCSVNRALRHLYCDKNTPKYDFIFLDKILPTFDNEFQHMETNGGDRILREMRRKEDNTPVITISSDVFTADGYDNVIKSIHYNFFVSLHKEITQIFKDRRIINE